MVYTVSEFHALIQEHLGQLGEVEVRGEVSEFKISQGKFVFFSLKDADTQIKCFLMAFSLPMPIEDGFEIVVTGAPAVFPKRGDFVMRVSNIAITGEGNLKRSLELLKKKLEKEGLFAAERKRRIPLYPRRIGLVASKDSAAITDFYRGLRDRWGGIEIVLASVAVQGKDAVRQVAAALSRLNESKDPLDLIVVIRGGGGLEDLMPFNTETVARAISSSRFPVVVGVGHERDVTIASLAADIRASTPTKAAEIAFPSRDEVLRSLIALEGDLWNGIERHVDDRWSALERTFFVFTEAYDRKLRRHYEISARLRQTLESFAHRAEIIRNEFLKFREFAAHLEMRVKLLRSSLAGAHSALVKLSPLEILNRGFAIITDRKGRVLRDASAITAGQELYIHLRSGYARARAESVVAATRHLKKLLMRRTERSSETTEELKD